MKPIPKAKPWEVTLADLRHQYATTVDEDGRAVIQRKIVSLEKAISIRNSLLASANGKLEFSL